MRIWGSRLDMMFAVCFLNLTKAFVPNRQGKRIPKRLMMSTDATSALEAIELGRDRLQPYFPYPLDDWQLQAGGEMCQGHNVIVCAPTGAGKTVVGEMALHLAFHNSDNKNNHAIYTTPLKALSNQKFTELRQRFGKEAVGLSTGDISINRYGPIRVMTTEVYRNMAWRSSGLVTEEQEEQSNSVDMFIEKEQDDELSNNAFVVLDEFHYMGQPGRGGVWEESVITTPSHTQIVGLSATLPNAYQLAQWMQQVSGRTTVLVEATGERPVPLRYLYATRKGLYPLFKDENAGPGAPKGLLGYQPPAETSRSKPQRKRDDNKQNNKSLPKGLHINPILTEASKRRESRVERELEDRRRESQDRDFDDWDGGGRRRDSRRSPRKLTKREEQRERDRLLRQAMRKDVPSLPVVIQRLDHKNLLPAIFFIFSRAGCENAAQQVCQKFMGPLRDVLDDDDMPSDTEVDKRKKKKKSKSRSRGQKGEQGMMADNDGRVFRKGSNFVPDDKFAAVLEDGFSDDLLNMTFDEQSPLNSANWEYFARAGLLSLDEVKEVASRVANYNEANEEIEFDEATIENFLFGVGSHHAGMLPAHKAFVESLYRSQLMKAVFATETLAAGINMPARTTCICNLAKRGDNSAMNLLATSNLLQMAGRAGRRGMDTDGTCVILSTPFETEHEASSILLSEIEPIKSQFAPSYSLAVNLIARGQGKLDVARRLVEKSFAMWEKRQAVESHSLELSADTVPLMDEFAEEARVNFMNTLLEVFKGLSENDDESDSGQTRFSDWVRLLESRKGLKAISKSYTGISQKINSERMTVGFLETDLDNLRNSIDGQDLVLELEGQIKLRQLSLESMEYEISQHPFTLIAEDTNQLLEGNSLEGQALAGELSRVPKNKVKAYEALTGRALTEFSKSFITINKRKKKKNNGDANEEINQIDLRRDPTWTEMLALTKVLVSYGCLKSVDYDYGESPNMMESATFSLTAAGAQVGDLSMDNSLWSLVAMGGAYDVVGASSQMDQFRDRMNDLESELDLWDDDLESSLDELFGPSPSKDDEEEQEDEEPLDTCARARQESENLSASLRKLKPYELAGYVSCLVSDGYQNRGGSQQQDTADCFRKLSSNQQEAVQASVVACERLIEVQKVCGIQGTIELDVSKAAVVTAWAAGCTWSETLELSTSGAAGDVVRLLGRVLDALRQFGNVSSKTTLRKDDVDREGVLVMNGISKEVRALCRDAATAMNRYPVKDPLPFGTDDSEVDDVFGDDEEEETPFEDDENKTSAAGDEGDVDSTDASSSDIGNEDEDGEPMATEAGMKLPDDASEGEASSDVAIQ